MTRTFAPNQECMKPGAWPPRDQMAWKVACRPCDPFDSRIGRASLWRTSTRQLYENAYGRWLTGLNLSGELDPEEAPGARATDARVQAFYRSLKEDQLAPYTISGRLMGLSRVLKAMEPDGDFGWIAIAASRIHTAARPVKDIEGRLRPLEDVLLLVYKLLWEAEHGNFRTDYERACLFRDGLIIGLLVHRAPRLANLSGIFIGKQLHRRGDAWWIAFSAAEMKGARDYECPWPDDLEGALEHYLAVHRLKLLGDPGKGRATPDALWISRGGEMAMRKNDVAHSVRRRTAEEFGASITPHHFRHLAATTIATDNPEAVTDAAGLLHHVSLATTEAHYIKAKQVEAGRRFQANVEAARGGRRRGRHDQVDMFGTGRTDRAIIADLIKGK